MKCDWCGDVHPEDKSLCFAFDQLFSRDEVMVFIELGERIFEWMFPWFPKLVVTRG